MIVKYKKQFKHCDYKNQDEDTSINRSIYNNDNSSYKKQLKHCDYKNQDEDTSINRSMYNNNDNSSS